MPRIAFGLALIAVMFGSVLAQEGGGKSRLTSGTEPNQGWPPRTARIDTESNPFVVRNGAIYVALAAGVLMPMADGGASGCFSVKSDPNIGKVPIVLKVPGTDQNKLFLSYFHMSSVFR